MKRILSALLAVLMLLTALPALAEAWVCDCGRSNDSNFCPSCGAKKPEPLVCGNCGYKPEEAYKFCPQCGTAFGQAEKAAAADRVFRVTDVTDHGDGTMTVSWEDTANGGPYTVWCSWGNSGPEQLGATDVYGTSCTVTCMERGMSYGVWVTDGAGKSEVYIHRGGTIANQYKYSVVALTDIFKNGVEVEEFSAADIAAYKASHGDVAEWDYPYTVDLRLLYDIPTDQHVRLQAFLLTDTYANILVAYEDDLLIPAGEEYTLTDTIRLNRFFESEQVEPGLYTISLYFDSQRAGMGIFSVVD